jgi:(2R)-ethylmalonyl-CoA mutase
MADPPWLMRTYSGHSTATASNALYRTNLAKGQTGLSIAFDLPTQTGYDPDHPLARGEVGKVGVPVVHLGHMRTLLDGIPPGAMNTSMTINATAAWLLGLYVANAEEHGVASTELRGTTQNDIVKEYLSRGTYIFPPEPSRRLIVDTIAWCSAHAPQWNPMNVCSYHLQEAGATPVREIAVRAADAIGVLDAVRDSGQVRRALPTVVGSISFFVNAGIRFIEEICKLRALAELWDRITLQRYGVEDPRLRRLRYGVQVNSLGLTEAQPENNVQRIVLEMLAVTLSKRARARSVQLPAWNEALGLPTPWDQQWSLRMQQVLAFESDLLDYEDIFDGSHVVEARTEELRVEATTELEDVLSLGGAFEAVEELKGRLVRSMAERTRRIESGQQVVVGVNRFTETAESPLGGAESIVKVDLAVEAEMVEGRQAVAGSPRPVRCGARVGALRAARPGPTTLPGGHHRARPGRRHDRRVGRLLAGLRRVHAPTGVRPPPEDVDPDTLAAVALRSRASRAVHPASSSPSPADGLQRRRADRRGGRGRGHGGRLLGIRLTPEQIAASARDEDPDVIGLSVLSGSHRQLVPEVLDRLAAEGVDAVVVVGGIIPEEDRDELLAAGVRAVYTPKDFELGRIMDEITGFTEERRAAV